MGQIIDNRFLDGESCYALGIKIEIGNVKIFKGQDQSRRL